MTLINTYPTAGTGRVLPVNNAGAVLSQVVPLIAKWLVMVLIHAVYEKLGMALVSVQRVELLTNQLAHHLAAFNPAFHNIDTQDFLTSFQNPNKTRKMLGQALQLLQLNPTLAIEVELDNYLLRRKFLVHRFWQNYLSAYNDQQAVAALKYCNEFINLSEKLESFFKGFIYFLSLSRMKDVPGLDPAIKQWEREGEIFMKALQEKNL